MAVIMSKLFTPPAAGKKASEYAVGDSVFIPVNGVNTEFLVAHQGNPDSSIYSTTFNDGTILLMKDVYENRQWHSSDVNDYENSTIHSYLNGTFLWLFSASVQNAIKQVKVPYRKGSYTSKAVTSGENGLSAKIFLLSGAEVGFTSSDAPELPTNEGAKLSYFEPGTSTSANNKRVAYLNGSVNDWWLRSPECVSSSKAHFVSSFGDVGDSYGFCLNSRGIRPALILPNTTKFDPNTNIIKG